MTWWSPTKCHIHKMTEMNSHGYSVNVYPLLLKNVFHLKNSQVFMTHHV